MMTLPCGLAHGQWNWFWSAFVGAFLLTAGLGLQSTFADEAPVIRSARSGAWSAADTWEGGKVPADGSRVLIREGHVIAYDVDSSAVLRAINIAGTLSFARDKNTRLDVGLIKIQAGDEYSEEGFDCDAHALESPPPGKPRPALEVGTPEKPIPVGITSLIRLTHVKGLNEQSCPAIVCCGGRMDFHGAPLSRAWVKLGATAKQGDSAVTLSEPVTGWRVGDRIIVTAANGKYNDGKKSPHTEERAIQTIDGAALTLDKPLEFEHLGDGDYRGEVANLSRNVIVESADPDGVRGHTMYHRGSAGAISYAEFRHLGKKDTLGRYSLHFHLVGETMRGSYVIGASIWDSHNRWLTIHGTNYLVARDNVGYQSMGHGYFLEDGTEQFNVLDRNLAVQAKRGKRLPKQVLSFDGNEGAGFWWANSRNTFTRNVTVESGQYGYRYEATPGSGHKLDFEVLQPDGSRTVVDIRTLPFVRFEGNESHSEAGLYACNLGEGVNRVGPDARHPFVVRNFTAWDVHYAFRPQVPSLLVENLTIHRAAYGVYHPNYDNHVYRNIVISQTNTEPFNRGHDDLSVQYGVLAIDGMTFRGNHMYGMPLIQISDDNPTGNGVTHIRDLKVENFTGSKERSIVNLGGGPRPQPKTPQGVPVIIHNYFGDGRHAKVVSTRAKDFSADGLEYRSEFPLTGDESRVAEVKDMEFPQLLDPVDDLPPCTMVTHVSRAGDKLLVRGTTTDNGEVRQVLVNGREAKETAPNFAEWEIELPMTEAKLSARAEDAAGNVEKLQHELHVTADSR